MHFSVAVMEEKKFSNWKYLMELIWFDFYLCVQNLTQKKHVNEND